jgi:hypothetical protein
LNGSRRPGKRNRLERTRKWEIVSEEFSMRKREEQKLAGGIQCLIKDEKCHVDDGQEVRQR